MGYGGESAMTAPGEVAFKRPSMTTQLTRERDALKERLADVETTLSVLQADPKIQTVIDCITRLGHLRG